MQTLQVSREVFDATHRQYQLPVLMSASNIEITSFTKACHDRYVTSRVPFCQPHLSAWRKLDSLTVPVKVTIATLKSCSITLLMARPFDAEWSSRQPNYRHGKIWNNLVTVFTSLLTKSITCQFVRWWRTNLACLHVDNVYKIIIIMTFFTITYRLKRLAHCLSIMSTYENVSVISKWWGRKYANWQRRRN